MPEISAVFRLLGLGDPLDFYDAIITGGVRKQPGRYGTLGELAAKPHPWLYAELAFGMGIRDKSSAVVLEDSLSGAAAGRLAGFSVLGFNDGNITAEGADNFVYAMVTSFDDVNKILF